MGRRLHVTPATLAFADDCRSLKTNGPIDTSMTTWKSFVRPCSIAWLDCCPAFPKVFSRLTSIAGSSPMYRQSVKVTFLWTLKTVLLHAEIGRLATESKQHF